MFFNNRIMLKKFLSFVLSVASAMAISFTASAQQPVPVTEDVAYELPAMVSEKTVPMFDNAFAGMPGVRVSFYCYNLNLIVLEVDRTVQKDNVSIEEKIHSIFRTDNTSMRLQPKVGFVKSGWLIMCNETDLIKR
jgi:hypothetical protein